MGRVAFLNEASRSGMAVIDMDEEEMEREFAQVWRTENAGHWEGSSLFSVGGGGKEEA